MKRVLLALAALAAPTTAQAHDPSDGFCPLLEKVAGRVMEKRQEGVNQTDLMLVANGMATESRRGVLITIIGDAFEVPIRNTSAQKKIEIAKYSKRVADTCNEVYSQ